MDGSRRAAALRSARGPEEPAALADRVAAKDEAARAPLKARDAKLGAYWDAWVDDARLVLLNALDAQERGAEIATRTEFLARGAMARPGPQPSRASEPCRRG